MKKIYEFHWDCGRQGDLTGIFVAESGDVEKIIGKEIYFGEVLGKHSEVYGILEPDELRVKTEDQAFLAEFERIFGENYSSGFNPLAYYEDGEED